VRRGAGGRESGFTLLETIVALAIMGVISVVIFTLLNNAQVLEARTVAMADLRGRARAALARIAEPLRDARASTLTPKSGPFSTSIRYERPAPMGATATAVTYLPFSEVRLEDEGGEWVNGVDDDKDGLVDERRVVEGLDGATPTALVVAGVGPLFDGETANGVDEAAEVVNSLIDEDGLYFVYDDTHKTVRIGITLIARIRSGEVLRWSEETTVRLRN